MEMGLNLLAGAATLGLLMVRVILVMAHIVTMVPTVGVQQQQQQQRWWVKADAEAD